MPKSKHKESPAAKPVVFIGSSTGSYPIAEAVSDSLKDSATIRLWRFAFDPGKSTLETILQHARESDFGVFVLAPDDKGQINGEDLMLTRDNVLFEAGVFMGALGPERTFLLRPKDSPEPLRCPVTWPVSRPCRTASRRTNCGTRQIGA